MATKYIKEFLYLPSQANKGDLVRRLAAWKTDPTEAAQVK